MRNRSFWYSVGSLLPHVRSCDDTLENYEDLTDHRSYIHNVNPVVKLKPEKKEEHSGLMQFKYTIFHIFTCTLENSYFQS